MTDFPRPPFQGSDLPPAPTPEEFETLTARVYKPPHLFYHPIFGLMSLPGTSGKVNIEAETLEQFRARQAAKKKP